MQAKLTLPYKAYPNKTLGRHSIANYWVTISSESAPFPLWAAHLVRVFRCFYVGKTLHYWVKICDHEGKVTDHTVRIVPWTQVAYLRRFKRG